MMEPDLARMPSPSHTGFPREAVLTTTPSHDDRPAGGLTPFSSLSCPRSRDQTGVGVLGSPGHAA
jgi:hypothetical protein